MWSSLVVLSQVILVIQSITVPTVWPKVNSDSSITQSVLRKQPSSTLPLSQHRLQHGTTVSSAPLRFEQPALQFRTPNNQEIYIYHPPPTTDKIKSAQYKNYKPQSYQIFTVDKQNKEKLIYPPIQTQSVFLNRKNVQPLKSEISANKSESEEKLQNEQENVEELTDQGKETSEENEEFNSQINEQEFPVKVPVKPIYPGEGQWAKYGLKHKPYIKYLKQVPVRDREEEVEETVPDGYETFETGQEKFQHAQNKYRHNLSTFPQKHHFKQSPIDYSQSESQPLYKTTDIGFVPKKLYTQVRRTEATHLLPRSAIDSEQEENAQRLREVIKDSKIHTVYTEEGYEDSAYDHAGHEKHAENSEGQSEIAEDEAKSTSKNRANGKNTYSEEGGKQRGNNSERRKSRNEDENKNGRFDESAKYENKDSVGASSNYVPTKIDELSSMNVKNIKLRNGDKENIDMEIHTEIKYVSGPQKKKHKFVKIIPSYKKHMGSESTEMETKNYTNKNLKRVKRYDKNQLSNRYIRKRPSYYWKKSKTTTTERPLLSMRRKFEAAFKTHNKLAKTTTETYFDEIARSNDSIIKLNIAEHKKYIDQTKVTSDIPVKKIKMHEELTTKSSITTATTSTSKSIVIPQTKEVYHDAVKDPETTIKSPKLAKQPKVNIRKFAVKRQKRYTIEHPNIDVDLKEFTDVTKLHAPTEKPNLTFIKYPYYKLPITDQINENSPLRYAEDIKNIPRKTEDLSFYESRSHIICPEVEADVDPVPSRADKQEERDEKETTHRLTGLGDKIDCFREKYFGENPLDSPFFQEESINTPISLFTTKINNFNNKIVKIPNDVEATVNLYYKTNNYNNKTSDKININSSKNMKNGDNFNVFPKKINNKESNLDINSEYFDESYNDNNTTRKRDIHVKILEPIVGIEDNIFESSTMNPIHQKAKAVLKPPFTLLEMMNMNLKKIKQQPTNIYEQITLIEDGEKNNHSQSNEKFIVIYDNENVSEINKLVPIHALETKINMIKPDVNGYKVSDVISDLSMLTHGMQQADVVKVVTENYTTQKAQISPNSKYLNSSKSKVKLSQKPKIQINKKKFKSKKKIIRIAQRRRAMNQPPIVITTSNVGSSTKKPITHSPSLSNFEIPQLVNALQEDLDNKETKPLLRNAYTGSEINKKSSLPQIFDITRFLPKILNHKIITSEVHYKDEIKPSEQMRVYSDVLKTINEAKEVLREPLPALNPLMVNLNVHNKSATKSQTGSIISTKDTQGINSVYSADIVIGLIPPSNAVPYRTLQQTITESTLNSEPLMEIQNAQPSQTINNYYVLGMKPPLQRKNSLRMLHKVSKRDTSIKTTIKPKHESQDLIMDESEIIENLINLHRHRGRAKRDLKFQIGTDDLIAKESRSYEVTPLRKPIVYKEIIRARPVKSKPTEESEEEDENLNPRKRIYQLKPTTSATTKSIIDRETDVFEEIPELTEPYTTREQVIYPVEPNSDNPNLAQYVFLIEKLHKKWEIEKPFTAVTEEIPVTTKVTVTNPEITQAVAESINVGTGEPAFLQIISHLHKIRKEEENQNPITSQVPVSTEKITVSLPELNSNPFILDSGMSDSFISELNPMQVKINSDKENVSNQDMSSHTRNFNGKFKTSIDTSKYKTIERSPVSLRHNFSSRYNAEDQELPLSTVQTTQLPTVISIATKSQPDDMHLFTDISSTASIVESTTRKTKQKADSEVLVTTTAKSRLQTRPRNRPNTMHKAVSVTTSPITRRRRPTRITTTEATISTTKSASLFSRRRSRFRPDRKNQTSTLETRIRTENPEIVVKDSNTGDNPEENNMQRRLKTIHERRVVSEVTLTRIFEPNSEELDSSSYENVGESKKHQYEIISPLLDTKSKHGGNYRHENNQPRGQEIDIMTAIVTPSESFYSDANLAVNVNQLKDKQLKTTEKYHASNNFLNRAEIKEKVLQNPVDTEVNLYPNMARMVNRLSEMHVDSKVPISVDKSEEDEIENGSSTEDKAMFIKDPSRRLYYYARL